MLRWKQPIVKRHCLDAVTDYIAGNLSLVGSRLAKIPAVARVEPEDTFLLWLEFRALQMPSEELTAFLRKKAGWGVARGPAFGDECIGFASVNIASTQRRLSVALGQLEAAITSPR